MRLTSQVLLFCASLFILGCASSTGTSSLKSVHKVFVVDPVASTLPETNALSNVVHDTAVHELNSLGYVTTTNPTEAEAMVRSTWHTRLDDSGHSIVSLSISVFDKAGHKLFSGDSGSAVLSSFWNEAHASSEVSNILVHLPHATVVDAPKAK
jgi:hypothetical protein